MAHRRQSSTKQRISEPFAFIPRKVIESDAYQALPDWAIRVLLGLVCQYNGHNNGDLSLTGSNFKRLGVRARWHVYAGLRLLEEVGLVVRTRQGGKPPVGCSLYAVTWRRVDESDKYDRPIAVGQKPTNDWHRWERPEGWTAYVQAIKRTAKGTAVAVRAGAHARGIEIARTPASGLACAATWGTSDDEIVPPVGVQQLPTAVPQAVGAF